MKILVAYYTRTGNTRRAAEAIAEGLRAVPYEVELEEISERKSRDGVVGFLVAGADSTLKRKAEIEPATADIAAFDLVIAGTPVWAWSVTPPVRTFLAAHAAEIKQAAFFCTMMGAGAQRAFEAMEEALDKTALATVALIDRHVRSGDEYEFIARVEEFVGEVERAIGKGAMKTRPVAVWAGSKREAEDEPGKKADEALQEGPPPEPGEKPGEKPGGGPEEAPAESGANVVTFETSAAFLERFDSFRGGVLRSVQLTYGPGHAPWSARVVLTGREVGSEQVDMGDAGEEGSTVDVALTVDGVRDIRMSELPENEGKHRTPNDALPDGIRIGFLDDLVYLDLRPRSDSAETLADFMESGLMIAGARCTWEVGPHVEPHVGRHMDEP